MKFIKNLFFLFLFLTNFSYAQVSVYAKVDHLVPDGVDILGGITLTVSGSTSPYTYTWNPGAISSKDITSKIAGQYTLNVKSASNQTYTAKYSIGFKVDWTGLDKCKFSNDSLVSTSGSTNLFSRAVSKNTLISGTDGWFEYVLDAAPYRTGYIGFTDSLSPNVNTFADIDFGFYIYVGGSIGYSENGSQVLFSGVTPKTGDVLRLERIGNAINYKINGVTKRTITVSGTSSLNYKLKAALTNQLRVLNLGCSFLPSGNITFPNFITDYSLITHVTKSGTNDGSVKVTPDLSGSYTYSWIPGGATTGSITGQTIGQYKINIKDADNIISPKYYNVGYKVGWTNLDLCTFQNDSLKGTSGSTTVYGRAVSKNTLVSNTDGWFEYVLSESLTRNSFIGFLDSVSPNGNSNVYTDIDFGFYLVGSNTSIYYYENGTSGQIMGMQHVGDILRIERVGNTINYKINDVCVRTYSASGLGAKTLKIKAALSTAVKVVNLGCSFNQAGYGYFANYINAYPLVKHVTGTNDGSVKVMPVITGTYTYTWNPSGATTNPITSLGLGQYNVNIKDSASNISSKYFNVGYKTNWTNLDNCYLSNDSLVSTTGLYYQYCQAVSKNTLMPNTDGWFEFVLNKVPTQLGYVGFLDSITPNTNRYDDIDFGFYIYSGGNIGYWKSGTTGWLTLDPKIGDILRIERVGNTINYKINNIVFYSTTISGLSAKALKIKAALTDGLKLINVGCSFNEGTGALFPNYVKVVPLIIRSTAPGINDGSISVKPQFFGLKSYSWEPMGVDIAKASALTYGSNTVTVSDSTNNLSSYTFGVGYKAQWKNVTSGFFRNDTLKANTTNTGYNYACTKNVLLPNTDGWFEYVITYLNSKGYYFGLSDSSANNTSAFNDIEYGFHYYYPNKNIYYFEGASSGDALLYRTPVIGDVLRIERLGNTINYKVNGQIYRTVTNSAIGSKAFKLKARLGYQNYLTNVGCSFTEHINTTIKHVSCIGATDGSITASMSGASSIFSYSWQPGSLTAGSISTLGVGSYSLTATSGTTSLSRTYHVGYKTRWKNLINCAMYTDTLKQTASGSANTWSVGAVASNILLAGIDGSIEYLVSSPFKNKVFGLLDSVASASNYIDIDYGVYLNSVGTLYRVNNGTMTALSSYEEGDIIRIDRVGDTIRYKKNGVLLWSNTISSGLKNKDWYVKASIYDYHAYLENVGCSFAPFDIKSMAIQDVNCIPGKNGVATLYTIGGDSPYTFNWNGGADTTSKKFYNLLANTYSVQVRDNNSCSVSKTFTVYNCPKWTNQLGSLTLNSDGDVIKTGGADSWTATAVSTIEPFMFADTAFWVSFNIADTLSQYMIGFRSTEADSISAQLTNYKLYVTGSTLTVIETDNDGFYNKREIAKISKGNSIKIQLTKDGIEYYKQQNETSSPELIYTSKLFSNTQFIIEDQIYKSGSRVNKVRVSRYGNTY